MILFLQKQRVGRESGAGGRKGLTKEREGRREGRLCIL